MTARLGKEVLSATGPCPICIGEEACGRDLVRTCPGANAGWKVPEPLTVSVICRASAKPDIIAPYSHVCSSRVTGFEK